MAEITSSAYQDLRDYVQANWKYIELRDEVGTAILRKDTTDARVTWVHGAGESELKLQFVIKGSDSDITIPSTFASSSIYNVATGGDSYSTESFTPFTFESENDELTVVHSIQIPQTV